MQKTFVFSGQLTAEQPLATCSKDLLDREGQKNQTIPVPSTTTSKGRRLMFPSTGLRGTLRRTARDAIRSAVARLTGDEKPFSLEQHYFLTLGGIKGEGEQDRSSVAHEAEWREKNPLLSVFGAGDAGFLGFVQGRLNVGNAICVEASEPTIFSGARTDDLYRDKTQIAYLSDADVENLVRQARGGKDRSSIQAEIKKVDQARKAARRTGSAEEVATLSARLESLQSDLDAVKESSGTTDVSIGMPLAGWQAIPQGSVMDHAFHLIRSTQIELGLVLQALNRFALNPFIGAHFANGCGLVSGSWEVFEATLDGKRSLGRITLTPFEPLNIDGAELADAAKAFDTFMDGRTWDFQIPVVK